MSRGRKIHKGEQEGMIVEVQETPKEYVNSEIRREYRAFKRRS